MLLFLQLDIVNQEKMLSGKQMSVKILHFKIYSSNLFHQWVDVLPECICCCKFNGIKQWSSQEKWHHMNVISMTQSWQHSRYWPRLWSAWGPAPGVSLRWLILQSKSSSRSWESWHASCHWSSPMLKLQAPGERNICSRWEKETEGGGRKVWDIWAGSCLAALQ